MSANLKMRMKELTERNNSSKNNDETTDSDKVPDVVYSSSDKESRKQSHTFPACFTIIGRSSRNRKSFGKQTTEKESPMKTESNDVGKTILTRRWSMPFRKKMVSTGVQTDISLCTHPCASQILTMPSTKESRSPSPLHTNWRLGYNTLPPSYRHQTSSYKNRAQHTARMRDPVNQTTADVEPHNWKETLSMDDRSLSRRLPSSVRPVQRSNQNTPRHKAEIVHVAVLSETNKTQSEFDGSDYMNMSPCKGRKSVPTGSNGNISVCEESGGNMNVAEETTTVSTSEDNSSDYMDMCMPPREKLVEHAAFPRQHVPFPRNKVSSLRYQVPSQGNQVQSQKNQVPSPRNRVPSPRNQVPSQRNKIMSPGNEIPSPRDRVVPPSDDVDSGEQQGPSLELSSQTDKFSDASDSAQYIGVTSSRSYQQCLNPCSRKRGLTR